MPIPPLGNLIDVGHVVVYRTSASWWRHASGAFPAGFEEGGRLEGQMSVVDAQEAGLEVVRSKYIVEPSAEWVPGQPHLDEWLIKA